MTCNMFYILLEEEKYISKRPAFINFGTNGQSSVSFLKWNWYFSLRFLEVEYL